MDTIRQAVTQYEAGDYAGARDALAPVAGDLSALGTTPLADTVLYFSAQATDLAGDPATALPLFQKLAGMRSPWSAEAKWREADCLHDVGRLDEAAALAASLVASKTAGGELAVALWYQADAAEADHHNDKAAGFLRSLYLQDPAHPLADRVADRITALTGSAPTYTTAEHIQRAQALDDLHLWPQALAELGADPSTLSADDRVQVELETANIHFHARDDYKAASTEFLDVWPHLSGEAAANALFLGARALSRADLDDDAITLYEQVVDKFPHTESARQAQYLSGWLQFNRERFREGLPALQKALANYGGDITNDARFCVAFSHYQLAEYTDALPVFKILAARPDQMGAEQGRYWEARTLDKLGQPGPANDLYLGLVRTYPFSWYALLSRTQLAARGTWVDPYGDVTPSSAPASAPVVTASLGAIDAGVASDDDIRRADALIAIGLPREAARELGAAEWGLLKEYGQKRALPVLLDRFAKASDFHHPEELADVFENGALHRPPATPEDRALWEGDFPRAYRSLVDEYGPSGGDPTDYLYAIMRQESGFNPDEVSYADAIGLLQMIPPTSERVGASLGVPYTDDLLFDPAGNIQFGAWYIGHLAQKFRMQIPLAAGSFNAGPAAMMKWCDQHGTHAMDEFVELVPYGQTRDYIRIVTSNYARYVYLYEGQDYQQTLALDPSYLTTDGIDY
jgi:soluble lytic murein transglycosylase